MRYEFKTKASGISVIWEDGKITARRSVLNALKEYSKAVQGSGHGMGTSGINYGSFPSADYLKTPLGTYLLLNSLEPTEIVEGQFNSDVLEALFGEGDVNERNG